MLDKALLQGLGGVIFFTKDIQNEKQFKNLVLDIKNKALISPFLSIDQEGGRVERTENLRSKRLSAKYAFEKGEKRAKPSDKAEKRTAPVGEKTEKSDVRKEAPRKDYSAYKRPEGSRPAPRKIEKAKDLDSYFAKLKEFSSNNPQ